MTSRNVLRTRQDFHSIIIQTNNLYNRIPYKNIKICSCTVLKINSIRYFYFMKTIIKYYWISFLKYICVYYYYFDNYEQKIKNLRQNI